MSETQDRPADKSPSEALGRLRRLGALTPFLVRHKGLITGAVIALLIAAAATLAIFRSFGALIDHGFAGDDPGRIDLYFLGMLGLIFILAVSTFFRFYFVTILGERIVAEIRAAVHDRVIGLSPEFFETNRPGEIASRLTTDTTLIQTVVGSSASIALRNLLIFFGGSVMLLFLSPRLMAMIVLVVPLVVVPLIVLGRRVRNLSRFSQDRVADVGAMADEAYNAIQIVQAFTHEEVEKRRFRQAVEKAFSTAKSRIKTRAWMTFTVILLIFGAIDFVLWQGAKDVIAARMSGGDLASFVGLSILVAGAVGALSEVYGEIQRAAGAAGRLAELLAMESNIRVPAHPRALPEPPRGIISFEKVTFNYPSKPETAALEDFSLDVAAGETVALVGPSGAGKSTVAQLLLRFFDPGTGRVLVDGVDIREVDPRDLRSRLAVVPQETVIFGTSAMENIRYGNPDAGDEEVIAAAEAAAAHDFLAALPEGYDTFLGEKGTRLSGGQRQRLAIARAVLRDAPILLLDEATSALDSEAERAVQNALDRLMIGRTTLVIAHRLATVLRADRIIVMEHGGIVDEGRHEALLAKGGLYARLAALQFDLQPAAE